MTSLSISGGDKLEKYMKELAKKISKGAAVDVGFLEGSTEGKENIPSAQVALWNEFGGTFTIPAHEQTIHRSIKENGEFNKNGRFVKQKDSNYETTHHVDAVTVTRPPRPFFRRMIWMGKEHWGVDLSELLQNTGYDSAKALALMGESMKGELQNSIKANVYAPLAKSTIRNKGNDQQLIESGDMWNAVDYEVNE